MTDSIHAIGGRRRGVPVSFRRFAWRLAIALCLAAGFLSPRAATLGRSPEEATLTSNGELDRLYESGRERFHRGDAAGCLRTSERMLAVARTAGNRRGEGLALDLIGNAWWAFERPGVAIGYFDESARIFRELGDAYREANALKDLGIACRTAGRHDEGILHLSRAVELFRLQDEPLDLASALSNLGQSYASLGAYRFALDAYESSMKPMLGRPDEDAFRMHQLTLEGFLVLDLEQPERARKLFEQALALIEAGTRTSIGVNEWVLLGLSSACFDLGDVDAAVRLRLESIAASRARHAPLSEAAGLRVLAEMVADREPDRALEYARRAIDLMTTHGESRELWLGHSTLGRLLRARGELDSAIEHFTLAVNDLEAARGHMTTSARRASYYERTRESYAALIDALLDRHERTGEERDVETAFAVLERAKARSLLEAIAEMHFEEDRDLSPELAARRVLLVARIAELQRSAEDPGGRAESRRQALEELDRTEEEFDSLLAEVRREGRGEAPASNSVTAAGARSMLDDRTAILAYSVGRAGLCGFVVTANRIEGRRLPVSSKDLTARVRNYVDLISISDDDAWRVVGRRLSADLVAPLLPDGLGSIERVLILADGALNALPFETLPVRDSSGESMLVERASVSYAPSATALDALGREVDGPRAERSMLVVADPATDRPTGASGTAEIVRALYDDEDLSIEPLPAALEEAGAIAGLASDASVLTGAEATEAAMKTGGLDGFRIVHFATHGLVSVRAPYRSALVLARGEDEDGFLQAREIYRLRMHSDLVVLSGCRTARGATVEGDGVQGLAQAFLHAGARSVVASLWNVNDERTATFMEAFYAHLARGATKTDALRSAKLEMLRRPGTSAPRYWAPFVLIGESRRPVVFAHSGRSGGLAVALGGAAGLLGILGLAVAVRRRRARAAH